MTDEVKDLFHGRQTPKKTLEEEYIVMRKTTDIDNWTNKRGPRPWEEQPATAKAE